MHRKLEDKTTTLHPVAGNISGERRKSLQHRESPAAQRAFDAYLDLQSARSLRGVHERLGRDWGKFGARKAPSLSTIENWSSWFSWSERTAAHDKELNRRNEERRLRDRVKDLEDRERRRKEIASMNALIYWNYITKNRIDENGNEVLDENGKPITVLKEAEEMDPAIWRVALSVNVEAEKSERLDTGLPTARSEHGSPGEIAAVAQPALQQFKPVSEESLEMMRVGLGRIATDLERCIELGVFEEELERERLEAEELKNGGMDL